MQAIIFDVDDTLYHRQDPFSLAFDRQFPDLSGLDHSRLFKSFLKYGNALFEDAMAGRIPMEEMYRKRIQLALAEYQATITNQAALDFQAAYLWEQEHIRLHPSYREMLDCCLAHSIFLAIITNGPSRHQRMKYRALGLPRWIPEESVIASGDIGINKPNVGIFHAAEEKWRLDLSRTLYVGDSYEHDILSAKSAGWHTLWLNRNRRSLTENHGAADYIAFTEEELGACIKELVSPNPPARI